jgi:transposase InsO family protein
MRQKDKQAPHSAEQTVRDIRRATRRHFSAEEKIRIVLEAQGMRHTRGKPYHPMTQGKIERWHLSLKSRILLENYYLPGDLERAVADFVDHYNHRRYHESLDNITPADVYFGRAARILERRREIKRRTIEHRRRQHFSAAA